MSRKPHCVLLPGFMLDERLWQYVSSDLSTVLQLHYGEISHDASVDRIAKRVLQAAPDQFILCGFSLGGIVAQAIASMSPERLQGLVLINTIAGMASETEAKQYQGQITLAKNSSFKGLTRRALQSALSPSHHDNNALLLLMQSMALKQGKTALLNGLEALKTRQYVALQHIKCPTCVITSDNDALFSAATSQKMANNIPGAEFHLIPDSGHMTPLEQPLLLTNIVMQWLQKQQTA